MNLKTLKSLRKSKSTLWSNGTWPANDGTPWIRWPMVAELQTSTTVWGADGDLVISKTTRGDADALIEAQHHLEEYLSGSKSVLARAAFRRIYKSVRNGVSNSGNCVPA